MFAFKYLCFASIFMLTVGCGQSKDVPEKPVSKSTKESPKKTSQTTSESQIDIAKIQLKSPATVLKKKYEKWTLAQEPRYFGPDNLYDLINGGSEIFVSYGFAQIATLDYKNPMYPTVSITIEVYDMGSELGAFGRVSKYLENMVSPKDAGKGLHDSMEHYGILGDGDLIFWKNKHLVHITLMDENPTATADSIAAISTEIIPPMGKSIFESMKDGKTIDALSWFPQLNRVERSQSWQYENPAGLAIGKGFTCRYKDDKAEWTLVISDTFADATAAKKALTAITSLPKVLSSKLLGESRIAAIVGDTDMAPSKEIIVEQLNKLVEKTTMK